MGTLTKTPEWVKSGPHDLEYKTYKMLGRVEQLKQQLLDNNLMGTLYEVDDTLDYLYKYDAIKVTSTDQHVENMISMGFEWDNLELVFSTEEQIEGNEILDQLCDRSIDEFENLHSLCREEWRKIEENLTYNYVPEKKYFLNDGFVFIKTPDNLMHIYHFSKPAKYFTQTWKDFKLLHIKTEAWHEKDYFKRLEEILNKKSDKIVFKVECKNDVILENNAIGVISNIIFSRLHKDYSF
jgi:hypothetical protein